MSKHIGWFVDGNWVTENSGRTIDVFNPATEELIGTVPANTAEDVDRAVRSAKEAFAAWSQTSYAERAVHLRKLRDGLATRAEEIATTIANDVGTPIRIASRIQAALPVTDVETYIDILDAGSDEPRVGNSVVVAEPIGVVAAITPWNYPLHQITAKLAPALAAGCTVVIKPSEVAPMVLEQLFDAIIEAEFPSGVINLVHGYGPEAGEALVTHPDVDAVSFTGSVAAGSRVAQLAAESIKKVTLELGGKSANVVLDDADLKTAVKVGVSNAFLNSGQTCTAWTRLLVPADRYDEAVELAAGFAESLTIGDPLDTATKLGPLVSAAQRDRVRGYIDNAAATGARLATGGSAAPNGVDRGFFVSPTVVADVDPKSVIAQEEIFGPVLVVLPYTNEKEALEIANGTNYGLHGCVWSADAARAEAFARRMRTGQVDVNGAAYNPKAPFGGYKHSGVGREMGREGLLEYQEIKSIQL
ncbi:aldehyde dehydrogenase family protein [Rhodococcus opacus]|uniref:aldehyde dehydrogenase (NAD(+)) n=1 Tax=Rhodococcus opacus TaxID=37919 RepID=A0A2S8IZ00_RHOOP|nr:aldehyde dehydrogenase family protein [Rhodococcus opacus]PQP20036.1 aldehyde dehydrogenase family protein [Rhodococcus opacus]